MASIQSDTPLVETHGIMITSSSHLRHRAESGNRDDPPPQHHEQNAKSPTTDLGALEKFKSHSRARTRGTSSAA